MLSSSIYQEIISHCGGVEQLVAIGARDFSADDSHLSFKLIHPNPRDVKSVTIALGQDGCFRMDCYGPLQRGGAESPAS